MNRKALCAFAFVVALGGCGPESANRDAQSIIQWARENPPVDGSTWQAVARLECVPKVVDVCDEKACRHVRIDNKLPPVTVNWYPKNGDLQRCDNGGPNCETLASEVSFSGSFASVHPKGKDHLFRVTASGEYREIATLLNDTIVYRGSCRRRF